jgi:hypothetical protein
MLLIFAAALLPSAFSGFCADRGLRLLSPQVKTTLLVSLAWMIFNMIPPYLLMHYQFVGRGTTLKIACK